MNGKFMSEMNLRLDLRTLLVDPLLKAKREYKSLKKQEIHDIFIKSN